jgi:hypothetical protein
MTLFQREQHGVSRPAPSAAESAGLRLRAGGDSKALTLNGFWCATMDCLPGLYARRASNVGGSFAPPLPENDGGGTAGSSEVVEHGKTDSASEPEVAGSQGPQLDRGAKARHCPRPARSAFGPHPEPQLPFAGQPTLVADVPNFSNKMPTKSAREYRPALA